MKWARNARFGEAIAIADAQGALSWHLRTAMSLARLWFGHGRRDGARELLAETYSRFTEGFGTGFGTADLKAAKALLDALYRPPEDAR